MADRHDQPQESLQGQAAVEKIQELADAAKTCMFGSGLNDFPYDFRPMAIQSVDDSGVAWFLSASDSKKNRDIALDARVMWTVQNDQEYSYLSIAGQAKVHTDRATVDRFWTSFADNWFDGKDDPRLTVIAVTPTDGHCWETKNGKIVSFVKMAVGAMTGSGSDAGVAAQLEVGAR